MRHIGSVAEYTTEERTADGDRLRAVLRLDRCLLGDGHTVTHGDRGELPYGYLSVSVSGELAPAGVRFGTNASSYGQVLDAARAPLRRVWSRWHLNRMRPGCIHLGGPGRTVGEECAWSGYRYGSAWLVDPLTAEGAADLLQVFGAPAGSVVVSRDGVAVFVADTVDAAAWFVLDTVPCSVSHAVRHEGWRLTYLDGSDAVPVEGDTAA